MPEKSINIRLLIQGCLNQNIGSQRKLYEYFYGYGMSICLRYAKNEVEAEEIFNDAFLKVFRKLNQYDPSFPFKGWLRKVIVNTAIDYYRKFQKHQVIFESDNMEVIADNSSLPMIDREADILPIIQQLSPKYKLVFNLYVMEGYKHQEIAEKLNISVGTSKSNLARAKDNIRAAWEKYYPKRGIK